MVLVMDWQQFWFIQRRNHLENPASSLCGSLEINVVREQGVSEYGHKRSRYTYQNKLHKQQLVTERLKNYNSALEIITKRIIEKKITIRSHNKSFHI